MTPRKSLMETLFNGNFLRNAYELNQLSQEEYEVERQQLNLRRLQFVRNRAIKHRKININVGRAENGKRNVEPLTRRT